MSMHPAHVSLWSSIGIVVVVLGVHARAQLPSSASSGAALWGVAGLFTLAWLLNSRRRVRAAALVTLVAIVLAAGSWAAHVASSRLADRLPASLEGVDLHIIGIIDDLPMATRHGTRFGFHVESCSPQCALRGRVQLSWTAPAVAHDLKWAPAQRWQLTVRLKRPHSPHNPGAFDRELRWLQDNVAAIGTVRHAVLLDAHASGLMWSLEWFRDRLRQAMLQAAGPVNAREAGVLAALAMGDQAAITPAQWTLFNQTGVGHLMSISGLHITMLAALGGRAAGALWRGPWGVRWGWPLRVPVQTVRLAAAVLVGLAYALLAGWGIPAQRTCFMLAVAALLLATGRMASIVSAVSAAAAIMTVLDPWAPLAAGFWLSFGAVMAIVWASSGLAFGLSRRARFIDSAWRTQWAATLALIPMGALFFGSVSLVGPLANAFAIPLVSAVITPAALLGAGLSLVWPQAAGWVLQPAAWLTAWLIRALEWLAAWPGSVVYLPRPEVLALVLGTAGCAVLLAPAGVPRRALGVLALVPIILVPLHRPKSDELYVTALDVGQGMAVVVQAAGRVLVYDTGPTLGPDADAGSRVIVPWLRAQGVRQIDALVVSHLDDDHSGGAVSLIRDMQPDWVASSLDPSHRILAGAARHIPCRRNDRWAWGEIEFEFLHPADPPEPARGSITNARSCVLRIRTPSHTLLLAGDIEAAQERRLIELYGSESLRSDVLLVPHHGSQTSSTAGFIDAVSPRIALFQVAYRSRFRHPNPNVLQRYKERDIRVLRSDHHGAITLYLRSHGVIETVNSRESPARYWRVPPVP